MGKKSVKWSAREQDLVRKLKLEQIQKNQNDWGIIANTLNLQFDVNKTAKQCRERYINYLKFGQNKSLNLNWSEQQQNLLLKLYLEGGPSWSCISKYFQNKSQNCIKNKFKRSLKMAAVFLNKHTTKLHKSKKMNDTLSTLLRASNQIIQLGKSKGYNLNYDSLILKFRSDLVRLCFKQHLFTPQEAQNFVKLTTVFSSKLKTFKMFKVKNKKNSIVSEKTIQSICQLDNLMKNEEEIKIQQKIESIIKLETKFQQSNIYFQPILHLPHPIFCPCIWCLNYQNITNIKIQNKMQ